MARTVRDAALLLGVLAGADPRDRATAAGKDKAAADYTKFLDAKGLAGARIGVARNFFGFHDAVEAVMTEALDAIKRQVATLVDPAELPNMDKVSEPENLVLFYEFKAGLNAYLAGLETKAPVRSLKELIAFNERSRREEMPFFGQNTFVKAEEKGSLTSKE